MAVQLSTVTPEHWTTASISGLQPAGLEMGAVVLLGPGFFHQQGVGHERKHP